MKKRMTINFLACFSISLILAALILLMVDSMVVFFGGVMPLAAAAGLTAVLVLALFCLCSRYKKQTLIVAGIALVFLVFLGTLGYGGWRWFARNAHYQNTDAGKNQLYGGRTVMLVVPHQDDDVNILGGVMEEYVRYGSDLYAVFVTNGDYEGLAETRYREALAVFESMGVPGDHVIFLGYGDSWQEGGPHIYNAESGIIVTSHLGEIQTYGTDVHAVYRENREYTIDNLTADLKDVIMECRPDVLFCSDYDHHIDHKATSLLFDKVVGMILKENPSYHPIVYKAYAYGTAWESEADFYESDNILSTRNLFDKPYGQRPAVYHWDDRIRFPVAGSTLSRSLTGSMAYGRLALYDSQGAVFMASRSVNGDKVAWQRYTDSLCLTAAIDVSSGDGAFLNDFMLIENSDLVNTGHLPYDGVWIPETGDTEKTLTVVLAEPSDVASIVLYDHPSEEYNILNAMVRFEDGTQMETGALDPGGAATTVLIGKKNVSAFSVCIQESEGALAGLSEIEAFAGEYRQDGRFIKLMDGEENFLYDYLLPEDGQAELKLYRYGNVPELTEADYTVGISGGEGSAVLENGNITVTCPVGEEFVLHVTCGEAGVSDNIYVRNPGALERSWIRFWKKAEQGFFECYSSKAYENLAVCRFLTKVSYVLRHL